MIRCPSAKNDEIKKWLKTVEKALKAEGFGPTPLQIHKRNQIFGLVKELDDIWDMHVRGFRDGHLEEEIEISRYFLEHPNTSRPASKELCEILDRYQIPYILRDHQPSIQSKKPLALTWWASVIYIILFFIFFKTFELFFKGFFEGFFYVLALILCFVTYFRFYKSERAKIGALTAIIVIFGVIFLRVIGVLKDFSSTAISVGVSEAVIIFFTLLILIAVAGLLVLVVLTIYRHWVK